MNRDIIEPGRTAVKLAESFALFGGVGAIVYPIVLYYVGYVTIDDKDDFLYCELKEKQEREITGENMVDEVRQTISFNALSMCVFLIIHFNLFVRPQSTKTFRICSGAFAIILSIEIIISFATIVMIAASVCNGESVATAALVAAFAVLAVNIWTLLASSIFFCAKTRPRTAQVSTATEERSSLVKAQNVTNSDANSSRPQTKVEEIEEEEQAPPQEPEDDGGIE